MNNLEGILWGGGYMSTDEESWASWKCDGGPHKGLETGQAVVKPLRREETLVAACAIVAYSGTESRLDAPRQPKIPNTFMAHLPA